MTSGAASGQAPLRAGSQRYAVERTLGRGGMATVYLARDTFLDRDVALKVLAEHFAEDDAYRERFLREARLAARLHHPNIVQVYDVGEDDRRPFIVMEYVEGETLAEALHHRGSLPPEEVVAIGIQLCSALEAAHAEGLVHRDIKPQNILRRTDGHVKLADFGIARSLAGTRHTEIGTVLGTASYLSPEQARGDQVTAAADIYSLGIVLYELLAGRTPFTADTLPELVLQREAGEPAPPSALVAGIPPALDAVIARSLARRPEDRPQSAAVLARELAASVDAPVTEPLPAPTGVLATRVIVRSSRLERRVAVATAAVLLALAAALGLAIAGSGGHHAPARKAPPHPVRAATVASTTPIVATTPAPAPAPAPGPVEHHGRAHGHDHGHGHGKGRGEGGD